LSFLNKPENIIKYEFDVLYPEVSKFEKYSLFEYFAIFC
jgi:hypothetical protein